MAALDLSNEIFSSPDSGGAVTTVYLDASDLFFYFAHHLQVSGIQRVQTELLTNILQRDNVSLKYVMTFRGEGTETIFAVPHDIATMIINYFRSGRLTRDRLDMMVMRMRSTSDPVSLGESDCYFLLGAFWVFPDTPAFLRRLANSGVKIGALIYDLIPIRHREYCEVSLTEGFTDAVLGVGACLSLAFTISDFVASDYAAFRAENDQPLIPVVSLPLAVERNTRPPAGQPNMQLLDELGPSFVMQVGTVEVRKNPRFALEVWRQLIAAGMLNLPKLVYVGRVGWRISDFMAELESTDYLDGNVMIVSGVSDADLAALYERTEFTMFPSFTEGWGLPVGESLALGVPCITSRMASLPEVAGDFGEYIDPYNIRSGVEAVQRLLDPEYRASQVQRIRKEYPLRSWATVGELFTTRLEATLPTVTAQRTHVDPLPAGRFFEIGSSSAGRSGSHMSALSLDGWSGIEGWGRWAITRRASLRFPIASTGAFRVLLILRSPPWFDDHQVEVCDREGRSLAARKIVHGGSTFVMGATITPVDGELELVIMTTGKVTAQGADPRLLHCGIEAFGFAAADDYSQQLLLLEQLAMNSFRNVHPMLADA